MSKAEPEPWSRRMPCGVEVALAPEDMEDYLPHYLGLDARQEILSVRVQEHIRGCETCSKGD